MDCSPPDSSVHGIIQARILEWVAMPSSRGSSWPGDGNYVSSNSYMAGWFFTIEPPGKSTKGIVLNSCSVVTDSLWPHGLQQDRLPCPSPTPGSCSSSCPSSQWSHQIIFSSIVSLSSCPQCFPASGSFPMSLLFASDGQSIGASASVLPVNIQGWFPLGLTSLISLQLRDSQESSPAPQFKSINSSVLSFL